MNFELAALGVLAALVAYIGVVLWREWRPQASTDWDSGDPGPLYERDSDV